MNRFSWYCTWIISRRSRIQLVLGVAIWRFLAIWRLILFSLINGLVYKDVSDVTMAPLSNHKISVNHLRVRMSDTDGWKLRVHRFFVNYVTWLRDSLPPLSCWNKTQIAFYMILEKQMILRGCVIHLLAQLTISTRTFLITLCPSSVYLFVCLLEVFFSKSIFYNFGGLLYQFFLSIFLIIFLSIILAVCTFGNTNGG